MLKALYDDDIVEEELITAWYDKASIGKVRYIIISFEEPLVPCLMLLMVHQPHLHQLWRLRLNRCNSLTQVLGIDAAAAAAVRDAARPFVEWLKEAESDEDSDEDE